MTFTKGPVAQCKTDPSIVRSESDKFTVVRASIARRRPERVANAQLIVAAFNAATTAEDMGYDGQAAVEALPELLKALAWYRDDDKRAVQGGVLESMYDRPAMQVLASCRPKEESQS